MKKNNVSYFFDGIQIGLLLAGFELDDRKDSDNKQIDFKYNDLEFSNLIAKILRRYDSHEDPRDGFGAVVDELMAIRSVFCVTDTFVKKK